MSYFTRNRYVAGNICFILFLAFLFSLAFSSMPNSAVAATNLTKNDVTEVQQQPASSLAAPIIITTAGQFDTVVEALLKYLVQNSNLVSQIVYQKTYNAVYSQIYGTVYGVVYNYILYLVYSTPPSGYVLDTYHLSVPVQGVEQGIWKVVYADVPVPVPRYVGGGGDGGGGAVPPSGPTVPPGAAPPVTDTTVNQAIAQAEQTGVVTISAPAGQDVVALTVAQLANIQEAGKPLAVQVSGVQFTLPPAVVATLAAVEGAQVQMTAATLPATEAQELAAQATNAALFQVAGNIYELNLVAVEQDGDQVAVANLGAGIRVSLPVPDNYREAAAAGTLVAGWYNEATNAWEELASTYDAATQTMVFEVTHLSKYALLEKVAVQPPQPLPRKTFADIVGHWAQDDIEIMAGLEIARGIGGDKFNPDGLVTRAEFAALLIRSLGIEEQPATQSHFKDVAVTDWYAGAVETAYANGLVSGYGDGTFRPNARITREEIAALVTRGLQRLGKTADVTGRVDSLLAKFTDQQQISSWARWAAAVAVDQGIVRGRGGNLFAPQANASRAEAVVMLKRMLVSAGRLSE